ncbi:sensor histidine kinase [Streptosporangium sp. NPDC001682]|uniref:sensor histidine kinase n=1 Tax=Streptosporangium sp. NPDC002544 TaxID=3154538 RepID=UPI003329E9FD
MWTYSLIVIVAALFAITVRLGFLLLRSHRQHRAAIEERGRLLEREGQRAARAAVQAERARIARELHDIVSHNVSLMVVQASAAREVLATMPDETEAALRAVEGAGRAAMTELRHLLGLLAPSPNGDDPPYRGGFPLAVDLVPSPSMSTLNTLVDRFAFAGLPVELRILGERRPLPPGIDATAYRIVQEALTNALKHAAGAKAEVTIRYAEHHVRVEVLNTGPSVLAGDPLGQADGHGAVRSKGAVHKGEPGAGAVTGSAAGSRRYDDGAGRGLLGLRERVALYGGDMDTRRRLGGGYRVRARLPLDGA